MSTPAKKTMLSAMTPSNRLQLGNYLGALKNWVRLQKEYDCLFFAVDLHAITIRQDPAHLRDLTLRAVANYIAGGIDPEHSLLFIQSHVPEHTELAWILSCFTYMGELERMTQYKDKSAKQGASIGVGLFTYPALMAADILLYQSDLVPVGDDQKQHLEITRDVAIRLNNLFTPLPKGAKPGSVPQLFTVPEVFIPPVGARIMSLQNPTAKMSKSDTESGGSVFLSDSDDEIRKKLKRAVTDSGSEIAYDDAKPGVRNLLTIQAAITGKPVADIVASYAGKQYGHLKVDTAELVVEAVRPIREKTDQLLADRAYLDSILKKGAEHARERAQKTLKQVYEKVGFVPGR
jgi:tryptophanyl-tRNA synthetase